MPKDKKDVTMLPTAIISKFNDIISKGEIIAPPLNLEEIKSAIIEINSVQVEIDTQRNNIEQRKRIVSFFFFFISFQSAMTFGAIFYCIYLMSNDRLSPEEYDWVLNVLRVGIIAIATEIIGCLGIAMHYFFKNEKNSKSCK